MFISQYVKSIFNKKNNKHQAIQIPREPQVEIFKFFKPLDIDETIFIFDGVYDSFPENRIPIWTGSAGSLSKFALGAHNVAGDYWSAFTLNKDWIGTSEF